MRWIFNIGAVSVSAEPSKGSSALAWELCCDISGDTCPFSNTNLHWNVRYIFQKKEHVFLSRREQSHLLNLINSKRDLIRRGLFLSVWK